MPNDVNPETARRIYAALPEDDRAGLRAAAIKALEELGVEPTEEAVEAGAVDAVREIAVRGAPLVNEALTPEEVVDVFNEVLRELPPEERERAFESGQVDEEAFDRFM
jgi:hypothetical protein